MIRAFIIKLDVEDITTLMDTAADIDDDLTKQGYVVVSVAPWRGHGTVAPTTTPAPPQLPPIV